MPPKTPADALGDLAITVAFAQSEGFGSPTPEFRFAPPRMFRFDLCWPDQKVALEREGGKFTMVRCQCGRKRTVFVSRHHSRKGLEKDIEKYNIAATLGWLLIRVTPGMISSGLAACHLLDALRARRDVFSVKEDRSSE